MIAVERCSGEFRNGRPSEGWCLTIELFGLQLMFWISR